MGRIREREKELHKRKWNLRARWCVRNGDPPLLFIDKEEACSGAQSAPKHLGMHPRTNERATCGRGGSTDPRSVQPILGLAETPGQPFGLCFVWLASMWALMPLLRAWHVSWWFSWQSGPMDPCDADVAACDSSKVLHMDW